jgi:hypothetical protein
VGWTWVGLGYTFTHGLCWVRHGLGAMAMGCSGQGMGWPCAGLDMD